MASHPHTPATMRVRMAVRGALGGMKRVHETSPHAQTQPLVLVALSGGADSLALAAATAAEAGGLGCRAGAIIIDHGLQRGSEHVAERAAQQAAALGLSPVIVRRVSVNRESSDGPEAAARIARYRALGEGSAELGAVCVLTAHTRDDQAEQVLLALARGSGTRSIAGIPPKRLLAGGVELVRPLLDERADVTRACTRASCEELGLHPWEDPHNSDSSFLRVRVRREALPHLADTLGADISGALARSADLAREDADALDDWAKAQFEHLVRIEEDESGAGGIRSARCSAEALNALPTAIRNRVIRRIAKVCFDSQLTREHTHAIASLVTAWRGQGPIHAPRILAIRQAGDLVILAR